MPIRPPVHGAAERKARVRAYDRARADDHAFYCSSAWLYVRKQALVRDLYQCQEPQCGASVAGKREANVDHILSRQERPDLELELSNLRTLCQSCHSRKTARQDGGFGNAISACDATTCDKVAGGSTSLNAKESK